jgi:5-formyltetrahydrofolate cyclo-ligase
MNSGMDKSEVRQAVRAKRDVAYRNAPTGTGDVFAKQFLGSVPVLRQAVVSGYLRTQSEADPGPILEALRRQGHEILLPTVEAKRELVFRHFVADSELVDGPLGIRMPPRSARQIDPDLLIVPLIAFDRTGHRLGYGAGYFDRALERLRKVKKIVAVGLAYAVQEVDRIPHEAHDQKLDWIVTEKEAIEVGR